MSDKKKSEVVIQKSSKTEGKEPKGSKVKFELRDEELDQVAGGGVSTAGHGGSSR